ncbi:4a-hydroxytetrahydrobiopterin dehydratase [Streptomyces sp. AJS327]|uniref:4a-hydroxytetrahydrobiopterin dehydratase n=1 Tax=Streptomyces sp. AJS327 TaxID=2545265 RepID=UPI0015DF4D13|nr:4a-hydroxytetrahydrobiopterin dehydratase [Streptomyces sp. AJS327]MBA0052207.1 4a-hydroxytetrahydrobiopterin dehydratase [Streptomyces sp. AJS327]
MPPEPLSPARVQEALAELPGWSVEEERVARHYRLPGHFPAAALVTHVAAIQEELGHHATLTLGYNTVDVAVNTHSVGGRITELDIALARRIEAIAAGHGAG